MSPTCRLVTIRLKRGWERASASASAPLETCVIAGNLLQIEFQRFADQQLVQAAVFAKNEGVVQAGDQQNVLHPERHQVLEAFEQPLRVHRDGFGCADHESFVSLWMIHVSSSVYGTCRNWCTIKRAAHRYRVSNTNGAELSTPFEFGWCDSRSNL